MARPIDIVLSVTMRVESDGDYERDVSRVQALLARAGAVVGEVEKIEDPERDSAQLLALHAHCHDEPCAGSRDCACDCGDCPN